jgi:hypothetical protein
MTSRHLLELPNELLLIVIEQIYPPGAFKQYVWDCPPLSKANAERVYENDYRPLMDWHKAVFDADRFLVANVSLTCHKFRELVDKVLLKHAVVITTQVGGGAKAKMLRWREVARAHKEQRMACRQKYEDARDRLYFGDRIHLVKRPAIEYEPRYS